MPRDQHARLAGTRDQHAHVGKAAEDAFGHLDAHARDRERALAHFGLAAHALADVQRLLHQRLEHAAQRAARERRLHAALHLAQDLALADDQAVQAGCDAEEMDQRVHVGVGVELLVGQVAEELRAHQRLQVAALLADHQRFGAVAGRDDADLLDAALLLQRAQHARQVGGADDVALARAQGRRAVREADQRQRDLGVHERARPQRLEWNASLGKKSRKLESSSTARPSAAASEARRALKPRMRAEKAITPK